MPSVLNSPDLAATVAEYRDLLARVDGWFSHCQRAAAAHIACHQGCSACCRGLFDITLLDSAILQQGFARLAPALQSQVLDKAQQRVQQLQQCWPDFDAPYILNTLPHQQWQQMPENDLTPCPLLGNDGLCLIYANRPTTCRLHGIPQINHDGEVFSEEYCTLNFTQIDPLQLIELRSDFRAIFQREAELLSRFSQQLTGQSRPEMDTFIATALFLDFSKIPGTV